jgi:urease accessory protein
VVRSASTRTSAAIRARGAAPLKLLVPRPSGPSVWACAATLGGGLLAGDHLALQVEVGRDAAALVTTQSTTKVHPSDGRSADQILRARVAAGGLLALLPDPVCCFAGAAYRQRQEIDLDADASLVLADGLSAGRVARGERWAFASYESRLCVRAAGRLLLHEALLLEDGPLSVVERLGPMDAIALVVLLGPRLRALSAQLLELLAARPAAPAPLLAAASPLGDGVVVRVAGERIDDVNRFVRGALAGLAPELGDDPFLRRY